MDKIVNAKKTELQLNIAGEISLVELNAQVNDICDQAEEQDNAVVVFRFTATDLNINAWPGPVGIREVNQWERTIRRLERLAAVTIAAASGTIGGPVLDFLLVADYRMASQNSKLKMPVNDGQVWPGMVIHRLVNQVGQAWVRRLLLGSREITAQQALHIGLIDEISDVTSEVMPLVELGLGKISSMEFSIRRQLLLEAQSTTFEDARGTYLAACERELRRLRGKNILVEQQESVK
jgi:isomerase DpgB